MGQLMILWIWLKEIMCGMWVQITSHHFWSHRIFRNWAR